MKDKGIIIKASRDQYKLVESTRNYVIHLRGVASGRGDEKNVASLSEERSRLSKEQADGQALKNSILRKEYVSSIEVEREWSEVLRRVRSKVMAVPSRVRQVLAHLTVTDVDLIDRELRNSLEEIAGDDQ
jgi:terminase small subunit / prophage DNA-packing protein